MIKIALTDWDDTIVNWTEELRIETMLEILGASSEVLRGSGYITPDETLQRIRTDFRGIVREARQFAEKIRINAKSATVLFDYLFAALPESKRAALITQAQIAYRDKAASKVTLFPGAIEELERLQKDGYFLYVISNKDDFNMEIEYKAVVKNNPRLAPLLPVTQVFATANEAEEKPNDFLHRKVLDHLYSTGKMSTDEQALQLLVIGDMPSRDGEGARTFYKTLFDKKNGFTFGDRTYPLPNPYSSQMCFVLFDPSQKQGSEHNLSLKNQGMDAFAVNSWEELGHMLTGGKKKTPKRTQLEDSSETVVNKYRNEFTPGYYMLRTKPRCWLEVTEDKTINIGKAPQNGSVDITFFDVEDELAPGRRRAYTQNQFVFDGKVFNAAAYLHFKDPQGQAYILFIKDKRDWNAPVGRVDGDELIKPENISFLNYVRGRGPENAHCILAALRELQEESGVDMSQFATERLKITTYPSNDIEGNTLTDEYNYETTVTTQVVVDLGTLTTEEIHKLQGQCRPQQAENIEQVQLIPVNQIKKRSEPERGYFWQTPGSETKQPIFNLVGRVITSLQDQKLAPFNIASAQIVRKRGVLRTQEGTSDYASNQQPSTGLTEHTNNVMTT